VKIVTVTLGSSSLRLDVFTVSAGTVVRDGKASRRVETASRRVEEMCVEFLTTIGSGFGCVAHRVVHGGRRFTRSVVIDAVVEDEIAWLAPLAPLHNPPALACIRACREALGPRVLQIAVFDTAFFADMPAVAASDALPPDLCQKHGIRRYGFQGLAHRALSRRLAELSPEPPDRGGGGRLVTFQLGSGCMAAAIKGDRPLDTSMGYSPLEGLVMATRGGDLDPGIVPYLIRNTCLSIAEVEAMLSGGAGLMSMASTTDLRALAYSQDVTERLAFDLYCYRARKYLGAYAAVLGGLDAVVSGGGVGKHVPEVRVAILGGMEWCGIELDGAINATSVGDGGGRPASRRQPAVLPCGSCPWMRGRFLLKKL